MSEEMLFQKVPYNKNEVFDPPPFPEVETRVLCKKVEFTQSRSGKDMIILSLEIMCEPELKGQYITNFKKYLVRDDMYGWNTKEIERAVDAFGVQNDEQGFAPGDFMNKEAAASIKHETGQDDKVRPQIRYFIAPAA